MAEREAHWREFEMVAVVIAVARTCLADGPPPTNLPAPSWWRCAAQPQCVCLRNRPAVWFFDPPYGAWSHR
jgi:hypothetical protein